MISAVAWIPHGAARRHPLRHELTAEEVKELRAKAAMETVAAQKASKKFAVSAAGDDEDEDGDLKPDTVERIMRDPAFASLRGVQLPAELRLGGESGGGAAGGAGATSGDHGGGGGDGEGADDGDDGLELDGDEESEEAELEAHPSDLFLLAANTDDDHSALEVYCYNTVDGSLFVHHDITLPALPLCMTWMDYAGSTAASTMIAQCGLAAEGITPDTFAGSYVAVGTFKPDIELWNLDVLDPLEPTLTLKGVKASRKGKKGAAGGGGSATSATAGHSDAVMGLAWNREHRHLLASGSADTSVKLWDLDAGGKVLQTFTHHSGKVQSVAWNPVETTILATGAYDGTAAVFDARDGDKAKVARYALPSDVESLVWNMHAPQCLIASCDNGDVLQYDVRVPSTPLWTLRAHAGATTCIALSPLAKGLMATAGLDKTVRVWDAAGSVGSDGTLPLLVGSKTMTIGQIFSIAFFPQTPFMLAAGGSTGVVALWDLMTDGGEVKPTPPMSEAAIAAAEGVPHASMTAKRFADRMVPVEEVPGIGVRHRVDGQPRA